MNILNCLLSNFIQEMYLIASEYNRSASVYTVVVFPAGRKVFLGVYISYQLNNRNASLYNTIQSAASKMILKLNQRLFKTVSTKTERNFMKEGLLC